MRYMNIFFRGLVLPISSCMGFLHLKKISVTNDNEEWSNSFLNKKVLIVGSGPSLDNVNNEYYSGFDSIIYINHAIKCSGKVSDEYFFTTDVKVANSISGQPYFNNIISNGKNKSIIAPVFFQQALFLNKNFINKFSWIVSYKASFKVFKTNKLFFGKKIPYTFIFQPKQPEESDLDIWFEQNNQVKYFPVIESTSALSAILFSAKYKPKSISMIGCDFSQGRATSIVDNCPEYTRNVFVDAKSKYYKLKYYLSIRNIKVENDSWINDK